ncbi:MAG: glutaredoxin family protein [Litorilinea sp.]
MQITLYTAPDCGLCTELKADLLALAEDAALRAHALDIHEVNIQQDTQLHSKFQYLVPVLELPNGELRYPPHDFLDLRNALVRAAQTSADSTFPPSTPGGGRHE